MDELSAFRLKKKKEALEAKTEQVILLPWQNRMKGLDPNAKFFINGTFSTNLPYDTVNDVIEHYREYAGDNKDGG